MNKILGVGTTEFVEDEELFIANDAILFVDVEGVILELVVDFVCANFGDIIFVVRLTVDEERCNNDDVGDDESEEAAAVVEVPVLPETGDGEERSFFEDVFTVESSCLIELLFCIGNTLLLSICFFELVSFSFCELRFGREFGDGSEGGVCDFVSESIFSILTSNLGRLFSRSSLPSDVEFDILLSIIYE
ncbi:unnamed protein product [[Candida] boidinii]|nr:unnamed protein product [[Candida] boidinii]